MGGAVVVQQCGREQGEHGTVVPADQTRTGCQQYVALAGREQQQHGDTLQDEQHDEDLLRADPVGQRADGHTHGCVENRQRTGRPGGQHGDVLTHVGRNGGSDIQPLLRAVGDAHGIDAMFGDQANGHQASE